VISQMSQLPAWSDTVDLTDELDGEVTCELPNPDSPPDAPIAPALRTRLPAGEGGHAAATSTLCARYVLEQPLGRGGTAVISQARDLRPEDTNGGDQYVAIKRLRPELRDRPGSIARLRREFHQTRSLPHPNIVRFYDFNCDQGNWFIAMEMLNGEALGDRMRRAEPAGLPAGEALRIASACGAALEFAHAHGVTHGDVKPGNVFVTAANEVRVLDFGTAASRLQTAPEDGVDYGRIAPSATRAYASPEVLTGQDPEPRDDVFSLACVIYEMLAGQHPYARRGANEARDAGMQIAPVPGLASRQWRALMAGLAWRREQRPADVRELLRGLGEAEPAAWAARPPARLPVAAAPRVVAPPVAANESSPAWRRAVAAACVTGLGVLGGIAGFELQSGARSESPVPAPGAVSGAAATADPGAPLPAPAMAIATAEAEPTAEPPAASAVPARAAASRVSFHGNSMTVSHRAVAAAVPVHRSGAVGQRGTAAWRVTDGTAVAGRDYGGPRSGVLRFAEGQTVSTIYVPIMAGADATLDRTFGIELAPSASGAAPGAQRRIAITIKGQD